MIDPKRQLIHLSAEMTHLLRAGEDAMTLSLEDYRRRFYYPVDREAAVRKAEAAYAAKQALQLEARVVRGDGQVIWARGSSSTATGAGGEPIIVGVVVDVTEPKRAEDRLRVDEHLTHREQTELELQRSELRWRTFIENAPIAISVQRHGRTLYANQTFRALWGYPTLAAVVGRPIAEQWAPPIGELLAARAPGATEPMAYEDVAQHQDGSQFPARVEVVDVELPDGAAAIAFVTDVTERKRTEDAIRESEARFRQIAETIDEVFWLRDPVKDEGLSTVLGIVQQSGGQIEVETELDQGTTFRIWLPVASGEDGLVVPVAADVELRGTETILLVEDEDAVRTLARTILARRGYRVLEARSGGDALVVCEGHLGAIDLVLTDVVMPLMSGEQLVARLRALRPDIRVAFMSGYPERSDARRTMSTPAVFIQKPFTPDSLLRRMREVLA